MAKVEDTGKILIVELGMKEAANLIAHLVMQMTNGSSHNLPQVPMSLSIQSFDNEQPINKTLNIYCNWKDK